MAVFLTV